MKVPSPATKPSLHSRPPLERMLRIHQAIQSGTYPNATRLARELEVSTKSIHRDLEFMRDRLELPLEYDGSRFGYHYTCGVSSFPTLQITEGELFALLWRKRPCSNTAAPVSSGRWSAPSERWPPRFRTPSH